MQVEDIFFSSFERTERSKLIPLVRVKGKGEMIFQVLTLCVLGNKLGFLKKVSLDSIGGVRPKEGIKDQSSVPSKVSGVNLLEKGKF